MVHCFHEEAMKNQDLCKCYSGKPYKDCCGPLHRGTPPPDALALMRSRYCAYALGNVDYIISSTHKDNALFRLPTALQKTQIKHFCDSTTFTSLEILEVVPGEPESTVTFRAGILQNGADCSFVEKSLFKKMAGFWKYFGVAR